MEKKWCIFFSILLTCVYSQELNVFASRHYDVDKKLYSLFEEKMEKEGMHVKVYWTQADSAALVQRIAKEGEDCAADLLITIDGESMHNAQNLVQTIDKDVSPTLLQNIPEKYSNQGKWFFLTKRGRVVVYHPDRTGPIPTYYEDLAKPEFKGQIFVRSSKSGYNQSLLAEMVYHHGIEKATSWARSVSQNMAQEPKGNDRSQVKSVVEQSDRRNPNCMAIINTYYLGLLSASKNDLEREVAQTVKVCPIRFENGGTHFEYTRAGILQHTKNFKLAVRFLEFLSSEEAQQIYCQENFEFPTNPNVELPEVMKNWGNFPEQSVSYGQYLPTARTIFEEVEWDKGATIK